MLAFKNRFHGHGSLRYVYKNGRPVRGRYATLKVTENPRRTSPRVAVVISKKVLKGAVGRNRIRRRIYEIIRHRLDQLTKQSLDIVCIVTSAELREMDKEQLESIIDELLQEAGIYKNSQ